MDPIKYVRALRRRWSVILATILVGGLAGWLTTATVAPVSGHPTHAYQAQTWLVVDPSSGSSGSGGPLLNLNTLALLTTSREVGDLVAKDIGFKGNPLELVNRVKATSNDQTSVLTIQATTTDARETEKLAESFASQLIVYVQQLQANNIRKQIQSLRDQLGRAQRHDHGGNGQSPTSSTPTSGKGGATTTTTGTSGTSDTSALQLQIQQLQNELTAPVGISIIQHASSTPVAQTGLSAPSSPAGRIALGALVGLFGGIVLALVLERFDDKIRTKETAEERFGRPVLAEVPKIPRSERRGVTSATRPTSPAADAFRLLGAGVTRLSANGVGSSEAHHPPFVVLVTSAAPSEGKSTVVANLAAVYAQLGKRVLILSCDLRRPTIHRYFGTADHPGLTDALASSNGRPVLEGRVAETAIAGVSLVPTGLSDPSRAGLLGSDQMRRVLQEARERADIVIMDTAPILIASEVAPLVAEVDAVVLVAEAGKTSGELASRTSEQLTRLGAPVVGVVLNRASETSLPKGYYRYYVLPKAPSNGTHAEPETPSEVEGVTSGGGSSTKPVA